MTQISYRLKQLPESVYNVVSIFVMFVFIQVLQGATMCTGVVCIDFGLFGIDFCPVFRLFVSYGAAILYFWLTPEMYIYSWWCIDRPLMNVDRIWRRSAFQWYLHQICKRKQVMLKTDFRQRLEHHMTCFVCRGTLGSNPNWMWIALVCHIYLNLMNVILPPEIRLLRRPFC